VKGSLETFITLDDLVDVGLDGDGGHSDCETHLYILYFISLISSLRSR